MSTDAVMLVYVEDYVKGEALISLGSQLMSEFGLTGEDFSQGGPLVYLPRADYDLAHVEGAPGFLLDLSLCRSYYGAGYERGDLPLFVGVAEWLERRLPGCRVFYGHDVTGEAFPFDEARRTKLMTYYERVGHEPYNRRDLTPEQMQQFYALYDT